MVSNEIILLSISIVCLVLSAILRLGKELILDILFKYVKVHTTDGNKNSALVLSKEDQHMLVVKYTKIINTISSLFLIISLALVIKLFSIFFGGR